MNQNWKKTFTIIFGGQIFSLLTSSIVQFAVIWFLTFQTGSAIVLGIATIVSMLPQIVLGPFIGVFIDRLDRKKVMMIADSVTAIASLVLGIIFFIQEPSHTVIYIILFIRALGSTFHTPSYQASVPLLAPEDKIVKISGINQTIIASMNIIGPVIAGALFGIMPIGAIIMLDVVGAAIAVISLAFVNIPRPQVEKKEQHFFKEMKEGIDELKKEKLILYLTIFATIGTILYMPMGSLYPLMTNNYFELGAVEASIAESVFAVGMLLGGVLLSVWGGFKKKQYTIIFAVLLLALSMLFCGFVPKNGFVLFIILAGIMGAAGTLFNAIYMAILQIRIRPEVLGRVFSFIMSLTLIGSPIGILLAVPIAEAIGVQNCFLVLGVILSIISVAMFFVPTIRREEIE